MIPSWGLLTEMQLLTLPLTLGQLGKDLVLPPLRGTEIIYFEFYSILVRFLEKFAL